jgi:hypothetical protein
MQLASRRSPGIRCVSAGLGDLDVKSSCRVSQAVVVAVETLDICAQAHNRCQMQGIERAQLGRVELGGDLEDRIIERDKRNGSESSMGSLRGQLAVTPSGTASLHGKQRAAEQLSADQLAAQGLALGLGAHELDEG